MLAASDPFFLKYAFAVPALPVLSFFLILFFGKKTPGKGSYIGIASVASAWVLSVVIAIQWLGRETEGHGNEVVRAAVDHKLFTWFQNGQISVEFGTHIDGLTVMLLFVVTTVSLMVHIYSTEYMKGDVRFTYFYAALSLFTASMLIMITGATTLQILLGWEGMGLCSFMLIGHWWEDKANSDAALKAFFTTRTGDIGLLVGISMLFFYAGQTFNIQTINEAALGGANSHLWLVVAACALLCAVIGKSAQFPLHTWLPDAMAGPTPVSALIHAATMVVAGVYLVARLFPVFAQAFSIFDQGTEWFGVNPVAVFGAITIIIAAALAFVQNDIKKVLAYSTVSQLGYMVMALGVGAWTAAIFHLFTHAFFKADLFLGAGSVSHGGSHHSFDMKKDMGGLRKHMPVTFATFVIGTIALAGLPPLAGFWSKDEILVTAGHNGYKIFLIVGLVGACMTAAYMARCVWLTFYGEPRGAAAHHHPHESPKAITVPLVVLSALACVSGVINAPGLHLFTKATNNKLVIEAMEHAGVKEAGFNVPLAVGSSLAALIALLLGFFYYEKNLLGFFHGRTAKSKSARGVVTLLENKYYLDVVYTNGVVGSIKGPIAQGAYWVNQNVLDGVVNGAGKTAVKAARFTYDIIDQQVVDGAVNGAGLGAEGAGSGLRLIQSGRVQQYAALLFGGAALLGAALVLFA